MLAAVDFLETLAAPIDFFFNLCQFNLVSFSICKTKCIEIPRFQAVEPIGANFQSHSLSNISFFFFNFVSRKQSITISSFDIKVVITISKVTTNVILTWLAVGESCSLSMHFK